MKFGRLVVGETAIKEYAALSARCNGAWVAAKNESAEPFGTAKDRRNAALLMKYSHLNPLIIVQITSGNSGYSLGMLARELDPSGERIKVVNIVAKGIDSDIKAELEFCSKVYETDLTNGIIDLPWMKKLARLATNYDGPDNNIIGVEGFRLKDGYSSIVDEIRSDLGGIYPTHIVVPVGSGELLTEVSYRAIELYGDKRPKVVGFTIGNNLFASEEDRKRIKDMGNRADKLQTGFSSYELLVRTLVQDGIADIRVVDGDSIIERCKFLMKMGIDVEPSAAVAFIGALQYGFTKEDRVVIVGSGNGNYWGVEESGSRRDKKKLEIGLGRKREEAAYVVEDRGTKMAHLANDLHNAILNGDIKKFDELLADSAPTDWTDDLGSCPLSIAISKGNAEMVKKLIKAKVDIERRTHFWDGKVQLGNYVVNRPTWNKEWTFGPPPEFIPYEYGCDTPLIRAAMMPNPEIVKILLDAKADVTADDHFKRTALHWAAILGRTENAKLLIANGAQNLPDYHEMTPLDYAAKFNRVDIVRELVRINPSGKGYEKAFSIACGEGNYEVVKILLGTDVNIREEALMNAIGKRGSYASLGIDKAYGGIRRDRNYFVSYGEENVNSDPIERIKTKPPWIVFLKEIPEVYSEFKRMRAFRDKNAFGASFLRIAEELIISGRIDFREKIQKIEYEKRRKPNSYTVLVDPDPLRFLKVAAKRGEADMAEMLLRQHEKIAGRKMDANDFCNMITEVSGEPIELEKKIKMVRFFAEKTPDINYPGGWLGRTALMAIVLSPRLRKDSAEVVDELIKCGARIDTLSDHECMGKRGEYPRRDSPEIPRLEKERVFIEDVRSRVVNARLYIGESTARELEKIEQILLKKHMENLNENKES